MSIVSTPEVLRQLRVPAGIDDDRVADIRAQAEAWATHVLGVNFDEGWTDETAPADLKTAVLARAHAIYDNDKDYFALSDRLIDRWRDHTLA